MNFELWKLNFDTYHWCWDKIIVDTQWLPWPQGQWLWMALHAQTKHKTTRQEVWTQVSINLEIGKSGNLWTVGSVPFGDGMLYLPSPRSIKDPLHSAALKMQTLSHCSKTGSIFSGQKTFVQTGQVITQLRFWMICIITTGPVTLCI